MGKFEKNLLAKNAVLPIMALYKEFFSSLYLGFGEAVDSL
jgi:hypothetical protein